MVFYSVLSNAAREELISSYLACSLASGSGIVVNEIAECFPKRRSTQDSGLLETAGLAMAWGSESVMADSGELILQVCPAPEDDVGELSETTGWLRAELLDLDVQKLAFFRIRTCRQARRALPSPLAGSGPAWP